MIRFSNGGHRETKRHDSRHTDAEDTQPPPSVGAWEIPRDRAWPARVYAPEELSDAE